MVIRIKFTHSRPYYFTDFEKVDVKLYHLLFDHFQFTLIYGHIIPVSYAVLFFTALDFISITSHIHNKSLFVVIYFFGMYDFIKQ